MEISLFSQSVINGIVLGLSVILVALGLNLVFGIMKIVNLAHGELYMLGAYLLWWFGVEHHLTYFPGFLLAVVSIAFLGIVLEKAFFKSIRGQVLPGFLISIGLILSLQSLAIIIFGEQPRGVPAPEILQGVLRGWGVAISMERVAVIVISLLCLVVMFQFIHRSKIGKAMQAVAQDPDAAALQGISINRISSIAMALGGGMAAVAGCLIGTISPISSTMGGPQLLEALVVITLGGIGSIPGTIVGGLIIGLTRGFVSTYANNTYASITVYLLLFVLLIFRPSGLFSRD
jgi:branched-chain amino acid transport system permease protein